MKHSLAARTSRLFRMKRTGSPGWNDLQAISTRTPEGVRRDSRVTADNPTGTARRRRAAIIRVFMGFLVSP
jgi:hypothetical protein